MTRAPSTRTATATKRDLFVVIAVALALLAAACSSAEPTATEVGDFVNNSAGTDATETTETESTGEEIDFRYTTFEGTEQAFSTLTDKPVVLNFFASWCPTCIAEMPDFEAVSQSFGGEVQFLGLAFQDRLQNAQALVLDTGVTYEVGVDEGENAFALVGGLGMPTTVFIDENGVVQRVHSGVLNQDGLTDLINEHLLS